MPHVEPKSKLVNSMATKSVFQPVSSCIRTSTRRSGESAETTDRESDADCSQDHSKRLAPFVYAPVTFSKMQVGIALQRVCVEFPDGFGRQRSGACCRSLYMLGLMP